MPSSAKRLESSYGRGGVNCLTKAASQKRHNNDANQNRVNCMCLCIPKGVHPTSWNGVSVYGGTTNAKHKKAWLPSKRVSLVGILFDTQGELELVYSWIIRLLVMVPSTRETLSSRIWKIDEYVYLDWWWTRVLDGFEPWESICNLSVLSILGSRCVPRRLAIRCNQWARHL